MSDRSLRTLSICLAASAALHLALVAQLPGFAIDLDAAETPLTAELVASDPPAAPPLPRPEPAVKQAAAPKKAAAPAPPPALIAAPAPEPTVSAMPEPIAAAAPDEPEEAEPVAAEAFAPEPGRIAAASEPPAATPEPAVPVAEATPEPPQPQTGTIRYEVYYGSDRFSIGRSVQTWSIDKSSYRLTSFSETTGLFGVFRPYQYAYVAEGRIEASGLKPEIFTVRRGRDGQRQATALFDWASGELTFGKLGSPRTSSLNGSSYDLLTLFYQLPRLALAPGRLQVSVTTGTKFNTYLLEIGTEEILNLPIGTVRAIPVKQVRTPGEESVAVWLAPEKHYLPVRIVFLDERGELAVEQVVTQIAVGTIAADGR